VFIALRCKHPDYFKTSRSQFIRRLACSSLMTTSQQSVWDQSIRAMVRDSWGFEVDCVVFDWERAQIRPINLISISALLTARLEQVLDSDWCPSLETGWAHWQSKHRQPNERDESQHNLIASGLESGLCRPARLPDRGVKESSSSSGPVQTMQVFKGNSGRAASYGLVSDALLRRGH